MKFPIRLFIPLFAILFSSTVLATSFKIDQSHTKIQFDITHLKFNEISGRFTDFTGNFNYDLDTGKLTDLTVNMVTKSIDTENLKRDNHLRSGDFFESKKYPTTKFTIKNIKLPLGQEKSIKGVLELHGVKKEINLKAVIQGPVTDPWGNKKIVFKVTGELTRKDFGLDWNKTLAGSIKDKLIGENVSLTIKGEGDFKSTGKK
jgi:polyisoprenoid-binding protein YceI